MKLSTRFSLGLVCSLLVFSLGCEDDPHDLDFLKQHPDAGTDASTPSDAATGADAAASSDAATLTGTDAGPDDAGSNDAGGDAG
ncbi:MAG TPA: hypothetical protein VF331_17175 [Polyangiales bacterium]